MIICFLMNLLASGISVNEEFLTHNGKYCNDSSNINDSLQRIGPNHSFHEYGSSTLD